MLTRRSLFARLSAVALAPLVKLVPKPEPQYVIGCDLAGPEPSYTVFRYASSDEMIAALNASHNRMVDELFSNTEQYLWPVPQEDSTMAAEVPAAMSPELTAPHFRASFKSQEEA